MGLILNDWRHLLRTETFHKTFLKIFQYKIKVTTKAKDSLIKKFTSVFNLIVINTTNKFISWPKVLEKHHILIPDILGKTLVRNALMESQIFSIWYKLIYFYLPLNSAICRMENAPNILCSKCKEQEESQPSLIFHCKLSKLL